MSLYEKQGMKTPEDIEYNMLNQVDVFLQEFETIRIAILAGIFDHLISC